MNRGRFLALFLLFDVLALGTAGLGYVIYTQVHAVPALPERTYTVVKGDTLGKIALAQHTTVPALIAKNGLTTDTIEVGQILVLPPQTEEQQKPLKPRNKSKRSPGQTLTSSGGPEPVVALKLPAEKPCKAGPTDVQGDEGMAGSVGLSYDQVRAGLGRFAVRTLRCIPPEGVDAQLSLAITVACTGRVADVTVNEGGGLTDEQLACVADTLRYAEFDAHDMPDGFLFEYPLQFVSAAPGSPE